MSSNGPRISPLSFEYKCPRLSLLIIMSISENQQNRNDILFYYSMHEYSSVRACFEHSNFFKVNLPAQTDTRRRAPACLWQNTRTNKPVPKAFGPTSVRRDPTTSFLTTTTLIYAIGAGITAAAGTRLALQLILVKGFKFYSFQLQDINALYCYFLSLPPCVRIG